MTLRIANGAGFLGDQIDAPRRLVESAEIDFLTIEHLAELTLSILANQRSKNPDAGYAADFLEILHTLIPALQSQSQLRLVANSGGMNPLGCAQASGRILTKAGLGDCLVATVTGDDIVGRLDDLQRAGCEFRHFDTGQPLSELGQPIVSANVYLGAAAIAQSVEKGARVLITGRVADASLTVGPAVQHFDWAWDDWDRLAAASIAGHLIECGAQVTGAYSTDWRNRQLADVGYPIAEMEADGSCVITKPIGSGGVVNRQTVTEQLVYEIGDPRHYLTPDVDVDFTSIELADAGKDRVRVSGARGRPSPGNLKVSMTYRAGYTATSQLLVFGNDCAEKARECADIVTARLAAAGFRLERLEMELLGSGGGVPGTSCRPHRVISDPQQHLPAGCQCETILRLSAYDSRREAVERFTKEIAPLITSGPAGLAGYASGRSSVRQVLAYWPTLVPRELVQPQSIVRPAHHWL